jgi:cytochrome c oxidase subunit 4
MRQAELGQCSRCNLLLKSGDEEMSEKSTSDAQESHGSLSIYLSVFVALCVLTACSFWTYSNLWPSALDSPYIKRAFMMAVSCTKAMLVILFFMHLKWEANWKWVLTIPAMMMSIFLMLVLIPDVGLRMKHASNERMKYAAEIPAETEEATETERVNSPGTH